MDLYEAFGYIHLLDYATIDIDNHHFFLTHGHLFDENNLPNLNKGDVFVYGHIHKQVVKEKEGIYIINPSSNTSDLIPL